MPVMAGVFEPANREWRTKRATEPAYFNFAATHTSPMLAAQRAQTRSARPHILPALR